MRTERRLDPTKYRDDPAAIAQYLDEALSNDDLADFLRAMNAVIRAQNVVALSEDTGLPRANLYRMFAGHSTPGLGNTLKVLASFGVKFVVKPRSSLRVKPPRPKSGRPKSASSSNVGRSRGSE